MSIESISLFENNKLNLIDQNTKATSASDNTAMFDMFLDASSKMYSETNNLQQDVAIKQVEFATGQSDDILGVMLAQEKATTALNFTVQVTNKVMDSYKEIMSIQL